ncbi:MAG: orotidine 5'-phosphate decarboxylase / HUMPS family protein, partial [Acidimicrobiia bacterium]
RVLTPAEAIERGADFLIVGRPITTATDPVGVARGILLEAR